ncbi:MAG: LCP family protein [Candidatus Riflebacteria bacterium]|nr:LCP family protein [Candidatus Riflebacteria bacterium]
MEDDNKLEQESDNIEKSENETNSESNTEVVDSAVSQTEEKNESAEDSGEEVVKEVNSELAEDSVETAETEEKSELADDSDGVVKEDEEEAKEAEVVVENNESEEKDYAEITEENKAAEEITEEAESENIEEVVSDDSNKSENTEETVTDDINKSEDVEEVVEPEVTEEKEASNENVEDADITEKESSEQSIVEASVDEESSGVKSEESDINKNTDEVSVVEEDSSDSKSEEAAVVEKEQIVEEIIIIEETQEDSSSSSSKPQAVLDELEKLKTVKAQTETTEVKAAEEKAEEVKASEESGKEAAVAAPTSLSDSDETDEAEEEFDFKKVFNKDFWKSFAFDVFFLALCVWFTFMLIQKWFSTREVIIQGTSQVHGSIESGEKTTVGNINILVMGIDSVEGTHRSDTIFVLGVNPSKKKIMMLSIPRDTRVIIEEKGRKINEILPRYGEPTLRAILEELLKIKITRKVEIGFESFISVIDAIGGVDINIEKPMHYDDNWGNLHIHFNPGMNHLNGQDALRYVRFRKDAMADLGRIKRQQDFVKAVIKKLFSPATIVRLPSIIESAFKHIKTDFTLQEILTLAKGFNSLDVKFSTMSLPGEARYVDKISFFMPYAEEAVYIGNNYFSDLAILEIEKECDFGKVIPKQSKTNRKK